MVEYLPSTISCSSWWGRLSPGTREPAPTHQTRPAKIVILAFHVRTAGLRTDSTVVTWAHVGIFQHLEAPGDAKIAIECSLRHSIGLA